VNETPASANFSAKRKPAPKPWYRSRGWWLKQLHNWHWMSAAISLIGMLLFAITGITLNHAGAISATPKVSNLSGQLPRSLLPQLAKPVSDTAPLPVAVASIVDSRLGLDPTGRPG